MERVAIVGLGLIGGSLGLALRRARLPGLEVVGHDREPKVAGQARRLGAVDRYEWNLLSAVSKANLVIIATPVQAVAEVMRQIAGHLPEGCVVTDTSSTKAQVMAWAEEYLPETVSFVGGHPMAGKEVSGPDGADYDLFNGAVYCVVPGRKAAPEAVKAVVGLVDVVGAKPLFIDAAEHDGFVAAVSHLPIVLSAALMATVTNGPQWREMARLSATGFRDVTRLASGNPEMSRDICLTNQEGIVRWLDAFMEELGRYRRLIAEGGEELGKEFVHIWEARERWLRQAKEPLDQERASLEIPSAGERFAGLLMGEKLARRLQEITKRAEDETKKQ